MEALREEAEKRTGRSGGRALRRIPWRDALAMLVLLAAGSVLRIYKLDYHSLWNDELESWRQSHQPSVGAVIDVVRRDVHPPGYLLLLYVLEKVAGDSEDALRAPSVVAGILAIFFIYLLGRRLFSSREGLVAAALTAVLLCPIYYSQEARVNAILFLSSIVSTHVWFLAFIEGRSSGKVFDGKVLLYVVLASVIPYLHYFGAFLIGLQAIYAGIVAVAGKRGRVRWLVAYAIAGLAYSPWLPAVLEDLGRTSYWLPRPQDLAFLELLLFFFNWSVAIVVAVICLLAFVILREIVEVGKAGPARIESILRRPTVVLVLWLVVPFTIVFVKSLVSSTSVLTGRSLIIELPAAYLLAARGLASLPLRTAFLRPLVAAIVVALLLHLIFVVDYYQTPSETQFREATRFVSDLDHQYSDTLILGYANYTEHFEYYFIRQGFSKRVAALVGRAEDTARADEIIRRARPQYVWYIYAQRRPDPSFVEFLERHLTILMSRQFGSGAGVMLFRNDRLRSAAGVDPPLPG